MERRRGPSFVKSEVPNTCGTLAMARDLFADIDINHPISLSLSLWLYNVQHHRELLSSSFSMSLRLSHLEE